MRAETYRGLSEIRDLLQGMQRAGRRFGIDNVEMNGDTIVARVEVADGGYIWAPRRLKLW